MDSWGVKSTRPRSNRRGLRAQGARGLRWGEGLKNSWLFDGSKKRLTK